MLSKVIFVTNNIYSIKRLGFPEKNFHVNMSRIHHVIPYFYYDYFTFYSFIFCKFNLPSKQEGALYHIFVVYNGRDFLSSFLSANMLKTQRIGIAF